MQCVDPVAGRLRAACDSGDASANECADRDVTGIAHSDRDAGADRNRCAAHVDAERDVHGSTGTTTDGDHTHVHDNDFV